MNTKIIIVLLTLIGFSEITNAQINWQKPSKTVIKKQANWVQLMYAENPNVLEVDAEYRKYYKENDFVKSYHTQYYKRWRRTVEKYINANGFIEMPSNEEKLAQRIKFEKEQAKNSQQKQAGDWSLVGPIVVFDEDGKRTAQQSNVYCIDQYAGDSQILYCGTETADVYKSTNGGESWVNLSLNDAYDGGIQSIEIHPENENIVYIGSGNHIFRTQDSGATWQSVLYAPGNVANEILIHPTNTNLIFATGNAGFHQSFDGGETWEKTFPQKTYDIKINPVDSDILYLVKHNALTNNCEFFKSTNGGISFTQKTEGWYYSAEVGRYDGGARIAVSKANPNRVYAYLIGEAKTDDNGFIGVFRSDDAGETWTLPNGPTGGPYNDTHINLAIGYPAWQYHQGYYNCAIMASPTNADEILVGGLNLWKSDDAGETFYPLAGYVGGDYNIHVDMQDFRVYDSVTWLTTDGGIYRSEDFFNTDNFATKMDGIYSADYWGFGTGWNEDVLIGGCYHNGNLSFYENYGYGNFLQLGGGEPASGYVNQGMNKRVYSSDINGRILPENIGDPIASAGFGIDPNESYFPTESTELEFDPTCYSIAYTGKDNELWKTEDGGTTFTLLHEFGNSDSQIISYIEVSRSQAGLIYVCQQLYGSVGKIWKTEDYGETWQELNLPSNINSRFMLIQLDPLNHEHLYMATGSSIGNNKVFETFNAGENWTNITNGIDYGDYARSLVYIGGSNGDLYLATDETVYHRNNDTNEWINFGEGLPVGANSNILRPFYRDQKLRLATYGTGVWEASFQENLQQPIAQIMASKLKVIQNCELESVRFVDYSILAHEGASWQWNFEGGTPASSNTWSADVVYNEAGTYLTTLTVTDQFGNSDTDSLYIEVETLTALTEVEESFEEDFLPYAFEIENPDNDLTWELNSDFGAYGESSQCAKVNGFDYWPGGAEDDLIINTNLKNHINAELSFDVAYVKYAVNYSDSLEVLIGVGCDGEYESIFFKGGDDLATAPDYTDGPFIPAVDEWRSETLDLSNYIGNEKVKIIFRFHSGWGQHIYLDNIDLAGEIEEEVIETSNNVAKKDNINLFPNILKQGDKLNAFTNINQEVELSFFTIDGKKVLHSSFTKQATIDLPKLASGTYLVVAKTNTMIKKFKITVL